MKNLRDTKKKNCTKRPTKVARKSAQNAENTLEGEEEGKKKILANNKEREKTTTEKKKKRERQKIKNSNQSGIKAPFTMSLR